MRVANRPLVAQAVVVRVMLVAVVAAVLAAPAAAADLDPGALVLRQADVPSGFRIDAADSGLRANATEVMSEPRLRTLFERWGRVTGYQAEFDRGTASISSRVDVLRSPSGARKLLAFVSREIGTSGIKGVQRHATPIGDGGWTYRGRTGRTGFTIVVWIDGRVFGGVAVTDLTSDRALGYARVQQRRMAAAPR